MTAGDVLWRLVCIKMFVFGWDADCGWREEMSRVTSTCCSRYHTSHSCCHARSWTIYQHLDMKSLNTQFLFQQSLNFSPQYDRQMRCIHTEQLSMSIWSVSQSSVLLLCKTDMLSFSVRTQRICRSHCESRQGNSASPLYQDFQWLLLELRCHPSSDP